jgi:hypothetical protein
VGSERLREAVLVGDATAYTLSGSVVGISAEAAATLATAAEMLP